MFSQSMHDTFGPRTTPFTFGPQHSAVLQGKFQLLPPAPRTTPFPEEKSILGVIYGVLLWANMSAATPLGARGRSVMSLVLTHVVCGMANYRAPPRPQCAAWLPP